MINTPAIDTLADKVGSKYALCIVAAKRARQIIDLEQNRVKDPLKANADPSKAVKPLSQAALDINSGKVTPIKF